MEPTLLPGDFLLFLESEGVPKCMRLLRRLSARKAPTVGSVVVLRSPEDPSLLLVKRCIAAGGQSVQLSAEGLYVNGTHSQYVRSQALPAHGNVDYGPTNIPSKHVFVLGDNFSVSEDSRHWGPVSEEDIVGRALIIFFSWDSTTLEKGTANVDSQPGLRSPLVTLLSRCRWRRIGLTIR